MRSQLCIVLPTSFSPLIMGCFLSARPPFHQLAGYLWWAAFSLCREHGVTPAWFGLGRTCISTTLAYTSTYTCVEQEGKNSVLLTSWQFSPSVCRCQKLRRGNVGGKKNCSFLLCQSLAWILHEHFASKWALCSVSCPVRGCWLIASNAHRMCDILEGVLQWSCKNMRLISSDKDMYRSGNNDTRHIK